MSLFLKNVSFHGILLDALFEEGNSDWEIVSRHLSEGIKAGVVQPLQTSVFERDNVEAAFRYMAQGKHIGKVLIKVSMTYFHSILNGVLATFKHIHKNIHKFDKLLATIFRCRMQYFN